MKTQSEILKKEIGMGEIAIAVAFLVLFIPAIAYFG
jgi:hypothetical protein